MTWEKLKKIGIQSGERRKPRPEIKGRAGGIFQKLLGSEKSGENDRGSIINSDRLASLIMKLMEAGRTCL